MEKNQKQTNWGIIGCGNVTELKSGPALNLVDNSKLVAVMRRDAAKAADYAARHSVPKWYSKAADLLQDGDINAIYIATPPSTHEEYALAAFETGKDVYLEKPMALNAESARRIASRALDTGRKLVIAHYRRALPTFEKVRELLIQNQIGKPLFVDLRMIKPQKREAGQNNWRLDPAISGGGIFHDLAPHQLDLMLHFFGEAEYATGFSANQTNISPADDYVSGLIKFKSGVNFRGLWSFACSTAEETDLCEIIGTEGKISFPVFGERISLWKNRKESIFYLPYPKHVQQPMIEKVVAYFQGKGPNPCPGEEAVESIRIMDVFTQQSKTSEREVNKNISTNEH
jgi:predicted dehydrogenase